MWVRSHARRVVVFVGEEWSEVEASHAPPTADAPERSLLARQDQPVEEVDVSPAEPAAGDADDPGEEIERPSWWRPPAPYEPGNLAALKHGAYSPRRVDPLATELVDATLEAAAAPGSSTGFLTEPSYRPAVWAWARAEAKIQLLTEYLEDHGGDIDAEGEIRGAASLLEKVERRCESLRARLGLDPLARARLGRDVAAGSVDVARLMAALEAATKGDEPDDDREDDDDA